MRMALLPQLIGPVSKATRQFSFGELIVSGSVKSLQDADPDPTRSGKCGQIGQETTPACLPQGRDLAQEIRRMKDPEIEGHRIQIPAHRPQHLRQRAIEAPHAQAKQ